MGTGADGVGRRGFLQACLAAGAGLGLVGAWGLGGKAFASGAERKRAVDGYYTLLPYWLHWLEYSSESRHSKCAMLWALVSSPQFKVRSAFFEYAIVSGPVSEHQHVSGWVRALLDEAAQSAPPGHRPFVAFTTLCVTWAGSLGMVPDEILWNTMHPDERKRVDGFVHSPGVGRQLVEQARRYQRSATRLRSMKTKDARKLVGNNVEGLIQQGFKKFNERIQIARDTMEVVAWQLADGELSWAEVLDDSCLHISNTTHVQLPAPHAPNGNNGVGQGYPDPQPPGNPPPNDLEGTGPGNPGNKKGKKH